MKFGLLFLLQDPPKGDHIPRLYDEVFEQAELAERRGFDAFFVPEHHQMPDEVTAEVKRYEREIDCRDMILRLRHPTGPSHQETMKCIELFGKKVLPQCR